MLPSGDDGLCGGIHAGDYEPDPGDLLGHDAAATFDVQRRQLSWMQAQLGDDLTQVTNPAWIDCSPERIERLGFVPPDVFICVVQVIVNRHVPPYSYSAFTSSMIV